MLTNKFNRIWASPHLKFYLFQLFFIGILLSGYYFKVPVYFLGWIAFSISAFAVTGNDSIQTIGTFIESKQHISWQKKSMAVGSAFVILFLIGWLVNNREVHFHHLDSIPDSNNFTLFQLIIPIFLVIITYHKIPISTTFFILSSFQLKENSLTQILSKSFWGYIIAFLCGIIVWGVLYKIAPEDYQKNKSPSLKSEKLWSVLQWFSTLYLWLTWLLQDLSNIIVYLPRKLNIIEVLVASIIMIGIVSYIVYKNGGPIQEIVSEKSDIQSSKECTIIDIVYGTVLLTFQYIDKIPMSTTWAFLGLLASREIILHIVTAEDEPYFSSLYKIGKDILLAFIGLFVSILIHSFS